MALHIPDRSRPTPAEYECTIMNVLLLCDSSNDEAAGSGQVEQIATTFGVDWPHLIAQIISFSIVCVLLYRFAYQPVLKMLEERRQHIAQGLANAEKIKAELAQTEAQRQEVMAQATPRRANSSRKPARRPPACGEQETQKAIAAAEQIMAKAREAAAQDHDRMLAELKREVGRLVVQATAAVTGKILTAEDQRRLAEETAKQSRGVTMKISKTSETRSQASVPLLSGQWLARRESCPASCATRPRVRASGSSGHPRSFFAVGETRPAPDTRPPSRAPPRYLRTCKRCPSRSDAPVWRRADHCVRPEPGVDWRDADQVGSDVYDGSVRAGLDALEKSF